MKKIMMMLLVSVLANPAFANPAYDPYRTDCTADQLTKINVAITKARTLLVGASSAIPPINSTQGEIFKRWFGGPEGDTDPVVKNVYDGIVAQLIFSKFWCPLPANFPGDKRDPGTFAWVPADASAEIFLEQLFFNSPTTGADSQAGTIIHELAHNSSIASIVDTDRNSDGKNDYGTKNAKLLASASPAGARRTADNMQYFAEDIAFGIK